MLALGIILVLLILLLCTPVGADACYESDFQLKLKIGFLRIKLLPAKAKDGQKEKKQPKKKNKEQKDAEQDPGKEKKRIKLTLHDIPELLHIGLTALGRFRRSLSIDLLHLHIVVAAADPYDAVVRFGALNAALGVLAPPAHKVLKIRKEDVRTDVNVLSAEGSISARLVATFQIWEILWIALSAACALLCWWLAKRKAAKAVHTEESIQEEKAS